MIRKLLGAIAICAALCDPAFAQTPPSVQIAITSQTGVINAVPWNNKSGLVTGPVIQTLFLADNTLETAINSLFTAFLPGQYQLALGFMPVKVINVAAYAPSVCQGANDTVAFNAAIAAATPFVGNDFWGASYVEIDVPAGACQVGALTFLPRMKLKGQGIGQTTLQLRANTNASMLNVSPLPNTYRPGTAAFAWFQLEGITLSGNNSAQTGTSHGLALLDDTNSFYGPGAILHDVNIFGFLNSGLDVGLNRNNGYLDRVDFAYNGGHGVENHNSYDWFVTNGSLGANTGDGWHQDAKGCTSFVNTSFFSNANGLYFGSGAGCNASIVGGVINDNKLAGIDNEGSTQIQLGGGVRVQDNSTTTNSAYPDILLNSAGQFITDGTIWAQTLSNKPSYLIQQTGTIGTIAWGPTNYIQTSSQPYAIAQFSNPSAISSAVPGSMENRIINGDFAINRRWGTNAANSPNGATIFTFDHWGNFGSTGSNKYQIQQDTASPPTGFGYDALFTSQSAYTPTATDVFWFRQAIEGVNIADLDWGTPNAKPAIFQFQVKSTVTGNFGGALNSTGSGSYYAWQCAITIANVYQDCAISIPGPTSGTFSATKGTAGLYAYFDLGSGSNAQTSTLNAWTSGSGIVAATGNIQLVATSGATLQIANVRLRRGIVPTHYIPRPFEEEMLLAERYYQTSIPDGTKVQQNAGLGGALCATNPIASAQISRFVALAPPMMASPTIVTFNPSVSNANWRDVTTSADVAVSVDPATAKGSTGFDISSSATIANIGDEACIHWSAQSELN